MRHPVLVYLDSVVIQSQRAEDHLKVRLVTLLIRVKRLSIEYIICNLFALAAPEPERDPCKPSPCGPYSLCRVKNNHAICSCQQNYIGSPPACRPECMVSADCPQDKACLNQICSDPCPGTCGLNARCQVVNHNPICSCPAGYVGDPFVRCLREESKLSFLMSFYLTYLLIYYQVLSFSKLYFLTVLLIFTFFVSLSSRKTSSSSTQWKSLCSFTLRSQFSVQAYWQYSRLLLFTELCRPPSELSSRMYHQCRVPRKLGMSEREMQRPMPRFLWATSYLPSGQAQSAMCLCSWLHGRSICWVLTYCTAK